jgi:hypothetical protein
VLSLHHIGALRCLAAPKTALLLLFPEDSSAGSRKSSMTSRLAAAATSKHSAATMQYCTHCCHAVLIASTIGAADAGAAAVIKVSPAKAASSSRR